MASVADGPVLSCCNKGLTSQLKDFHFLHGDLRVSFFIAGKTDCVFQTACLIPEEVEGVFTPLNMRVTDDQAMSPAVMYAV
jgi:hypothetical protein